VNNQATKIIDFAPKGQINKAQGAQALGHLFCPIMQALKERISK